MPTLEIAVFDDGEIFIIFAYDNDFIGPKQPITYAWMII